MLKKLSDLYSLIGKQNKKKRLVLAVADDHHALDAVYNAYKKSIVDLILVGNYEEIKNLSEKYSYDLSSFEIIDESNKKKATQIAVQIVNSKRADILMKGNVATGIFLGGVLNKEWGLTGGKKSLLSHYSIFEIPNYHKLLSLTDVAMNIAPDLKEKIGIINNSVNFMNKISIKNPKVAMIGAVETVNPKMQATVDAALIAKMNQRNQIKNCIIDGPLAFDNAISKESAIHKGIKSNVAGDADLLVFPNIESGNVIYKALSYFANSKLAAVILGASAPIVLTSRSDSEEAKLNSILLAAVSK